MLAARLVDMRLYHRTASGSLILEKGFRDTSGTYLTGEEHEGVFLSDTPLDWNEGAKGEDLLSVEIPEKMISDYEWVQEGKPYREWLVPAAVVNSYPAEWAGECGNCGALHSRSDGKPCSECGYAP